MRQSIDNPHRIVKTGLIYLQSRRIWFGRRASTLLSGTLAEPTGASEQFDADADGGYLHRSATRFPRSILKIHPQRNRHDRCAFIGVEHIGREIEMLVGVTDHQTALEVSVGLVRVGTLSCEAEAEMIEG